jgi:acyl carrier protein
VTQEAARQMLVGALLEVAPEFDAAACDPGESLRDAADLDSMDFYTLVGLLADALGADIPQDDYPRLDTLGGAVSYLAAR